MSNLEKQFLKALSYFTNQMNAIERKQSEGKETVNQQIGYLLCKYNGIEQQISLDTQWS